MKNLLLLSILSLAGFFVGACENVQLSFLFNPSIAPTVVNYTLENANGGVETFSVEINPNGYGTTTHCLPLSCFELNFIFSNIQPADVYSIAYTAGNVTENWIPNFSNNGAIENPFTFCVDTSNCFLAADIITAVCGQVTLIATSNAANALYSFYVDNEIYTSQESVLVLDNLSIGEHTYCVTSTADICDNEEVCGSFIVDACDCPNELVVDMVSDCLAIFHPEMFTPDAFVLYYVDGVQVSLGEPVFTYLFSSSGEFEVCMESCGEFYCQTFIVEGCGNSGDCPTTTFYQGDGCSWQFEIGSFSPGENVTWNFGDGTEIDGGHFIEYVYDAPGEYQVTAFYTSNGCPNGTAFSFDINVEGCGNECDPYLEVTNDGCNYTVTLFPELGWIDQVYWTVNNLTMVGSTTMTFELPEQGLNVICAESVNTICNQGYSICTTVESIGCAADCTPYLFHLIAPVEPGAVQIINWQIAGENGIVESGVQTFVNDNPTFVQDFCLPDGCYSILIQSTTPVQNTQVWMSNANGETPWSADPIWDSLSAYFQFGVNADCNDTEDCTLEVAYSQTENGNNLFTAFPSFDGAVVDWFLDGEFYETGNIVDGVFDAGVHEMCASYETPNCPEGATQCITFVILADIPACTEVLISIDPQGLPTNDLNFDFQLETVFENLPLEISGAFTIYEECNGTFIGVCLPNGCYTLSMSMEEFLQFGILINVLVEGGLDVNYIIDPLTQTVGLEFGINNNCDNSVNEFSFEKVSVYPIPSQGVLVLSQSQSATSWQIFDLSGRMVLSGANLQGIATIDASVLSNGNYLLQLHQQDAVTFQKIQILK
jgi:hypothetical protein